MSMAFWIAAFVFAVVFFAALVVGWIVAAFAQSHEAMNEDR